MRTDENTKCKDGSGYSLVPEDEHTNLDPELQSAILDAVEGVAARVDVIARLKDAGGNLPEQLQEIQQIGDVVTGSLDVKDIVLVRGHENIYSLKGARPVRPALDSSVSEIGAAQHQLRASFVSKKLDGKGVIVGVVDQGCGFAHPNFRNENGTRILYLWDQRVESASHPPPKGFTYGREFDAPTINEALELAPPDCYTSLDYGDITERPHGTRVLDIAAGSGTGTNPPGVAPNADIIFVDLADDPNLLPGEPFGNSRRLLEAVRYIFGKADEIAEKEGSLRSVVVNVSIASDSGPHDGSTPFERGLDNLLQQKPGRAVVLAAGNSAVALTSSPTLGRHAARVLQPGQPTSLTWQINDGNIKDVKVDIWYGGEQQVALSLIPPGGVPLGPFHLGTTTTICRDGKSSARVIHRHNDPNNHDNEIVLFFSPLMEPGEWLVVLSPLGSLPFTVHAWVVSHGAPGSGFLDPPRSDDAYTINSIACGQSSIAVGAYFTVAPHNILPSSAEGPTRDGRLKPEVSAPGGSAPGGSAVENASALPFVGGLNAAEVLNSGFTRSNEGGTSAAAPHVAGLIALLMQNAPAPLSIADIRDQVINTARRLPANDCAWHPRFGVGRIEARRAIRSQSQVGATPNSGVAPVLTASTGATPAALAQDVGGVPDADDANAAHEASLKVEMV